MNRTDPSESDRSKSNPIARFRAGGRAADAGWTLSGSVIGCLLIGYLIGQATSSNPTATVAGLIIGLVVGFYNLAKVMGIIE